MASAGGARGTAGPPLLMMRAMITRVEGVLESVEGNEAVVRLAGGVCLEVMLSAHAAGRLATQVGAVGEAVLTYKPDDPKYPEIVKHLGGIKPGETKPVPAFPEEPAK